MGAGMIAGLGTGYVQGQQQAQERNLQKQYLDLAQKKFKNEDDMAALQRNVLQLNIQKGVLGLKGYMDYMNRMNGGNQNSAPPQSMAPLADGQTDQGTQPQSLNSAPSQNQTPVAPQNDALRNRNDLQALAMLNDPSEFFKSQLQTKTVGNKLIDEQGNVIRDFGPPQQNITQDEKGAYFAGRAAQMGLSGPNGEGLPIEEISKRDPAKALKIANEWNTKEIEKAKAARSVFGDIRIQPVIDEKGNLTFASPNQINKNPGKFTPAVEGSKAMGKTALMEDIRGNLQLTRQSLQNMPEFTSTQAAQIAMAMKGGQGAMQSFINSAIGKALDPAQIDYITNLAQTRENAMAMRAVLGAGQGSQDLRDATNAMIPGAQTPTKAFAMKQLDKFEMTLNRLERGVPKVNLPAEKQMPGQQGNQNTGNTFNSIDDALAHYGAQKKK